MEGSVRSRFPDTAHFWRRVGAWDVFDKLGGVGCLEAVWRLVKDDEIEVEIRVLRWSRDLLYEVNR